MKTVLTVLTLLTFFSCNSQTLEVTYVEKKDLTEQLKAIDNPMIKQMVMEKAGQPNYCQLLSNQGVSVYKRKEKVDKTSDMNSGVTMMESGSESITYKNHNEDLYVNQTDFMSRIFLIEDKLNKNEWVITEETQKIGDYECKKATLQREDKQIVAWFTSEIPSNEGPRDYYGLPGLILKVETGSLVIEASDISVSKEKIDLERPTKGKKVTQEEFDKIKAEKIKGLTGSIQSGGNGVKIIKMQ